MILERKRLFQKEQKLQNRPFHRKFLHQEVSTCLFSTCELCGICGKSKSARKHTENQSVAKITRIRTENRVKIASKRVQSDACIDFAERKQARRNLVNCC